MHENIDKLIIMHEFYAWMVQEVLECWKLSDKRQCTVRNATNLEKASALEPIYAFTFYIGFHKVVWTIHLNH